MTKIFTENDLIRYLYGETSEIETSEIKTQLKGNIAILLRCLVSEVCSYTSQVSGELTKIFPLFYHLIGRFVFEKGGR